MEERNILKTAIFYIIGYIAISTLASVFNNLFMGLNSYFAIESETLILLIQSLLGIITVFIFVIIYNTLLKRKIVPISYVWISFVIVLILVIGNLFISSLATISSLQTRGQLVYSYHQTSTFVSSLVIVPIGLFIFFMVKIYKRM